MAVLLSSKAFSCHVLSLSFARNIRQAPFTNGHAYHLLSQRGSFRGNTFHKFRHRKPPQCHQTTNRLQSNSHGPGRQGKIEGLPKVSLFKRLVGQVGPQKRNWHPGSSNLNPNEVGIAGAKPVRYIDMMKSMLTYIWPKDNLRFKIRVVIALGLLVGAKVRYRGFVFYCLNKFKRQHTRQSSFRDSMALILCVTHCSLTIFTSEHNSLTDCQPLQSARKTKFSSLENMI
ncbi:uncharacterized protein LOC106012294 [Aplysia californica]|uniref:Uncharacterized protein LOC106012294 n=1 Tax=Aplysia californica TaxID=6500 RepID=A0ABM1A3S7_APLCA|nr:uncharacterized protein LOC106012294 [Aplysia californica]